MIHVLLQIFVFQFLFLAVYELFLKKETFFTPNRVYLILTPILSMALPFISLGIIQENIPQEFYAQMPPILLGETASQTSGYLALSMGLKGLWIMGTIMSALIFFFKVFRIIKLQRSGITRYVEGYRLTILPKTDTAFSFFNTIYLGADISEEKKEDIMAHEMMHLKQKHSLDLLYFELLRIVFWFNPLIYVFQNKIATLHEYIADAEIARNKDKRIYYQILLSEVFQCQEISFINTFFKQSLLKKRIVMLQKSKSAKIKMTKYLMLLPILGIMLVYSSCSDTIEIPEQDQLTMPPPPPPPPPMPPAPPSSPERGTGEVPYAIIDQAPIYPGCSGDNEAMKKCMSVRISEFINENFDTGIGTDLNLSGRQRMVVQFKIDKTGKVVNVRARASHPELEGEAVRVVGMLPKMRPGEHGGKKVGVLYSLPIVFDVQ